MVWTRHKNDSTTQFKRQLKNRQIIINIKSQTHLLPARLYLIIHLSNLFMQCLRLFSNRFVNHFDLEPRTNSQICYGLIDYMYTVPEMSVSVCV